MAKIYRCDVCKRDTVEIIGKLFFTPLVPSRGANGFSTHYSHHLDVGSCCRNRLLTSFQWQERQTAAEYAQNRRKPRRARA